MCAMVNGFSSERDDHLKLILGFSDVENGTKNNGEGGITIPQSMEQLPVLTMAHVKVWERQRNDEKRGSLHDLGAKLDSG